MDIIKRTVVKPLKLHEYFLFQIEGIITKFQSYIFSELKGTTLQNSESLNEVEELYNVFEDLKIT